jgi:hypothetical protein
VRTKGVADADARKCADLLALCATLHALCTAVRRSCAELHAPCAKLLTSCTGLRGSCTKLLTSCALLAHDLRETAHALHDRGESAGWGLLPGADFCWVNLEKVGWLTAIAGMGCYGRGGGRRGCYLAWHKSRFHTPCGRLLPRKRIIP